MNTLITSYCWMWIINRACAATRGKQWNMRYMSEMAFSCFVFGKLFRSVHALHPTRDLQVRQNPPDFLNWSCLLLALQLVELILVLRPVLQWFGGVVERRSGGGPVAVRWCSGPVVLCKNSMRILRSFNCWKHLPLVLLLRKQPPGWSSLLPVLAVLCPLVPTWVFPRWRSRVCQCRRFVFPVSHVEFLHVGACRRPPVLVDFPGVIQCL